MEIADLVREHNRSFGGLYYDGLERRGELELSWSIGAEAPFYSAVHHATHLDDRELDAIEAFYRDHDLPAAIYLDPRADDSLAPRLVARGYVELEDQRERWWSREPDASEPVEPPAGIRIEPVTDRRALAAFVALDAEVNGLSGSTRTKLASRLEVALQRGGLELTAAYAGPEIVATAGACVVDARRYLLEAATRPDWQRRGLHATLTRHRIASAYRAGARCVVMVCAAAAWSNATAAKLGFRERFQRRLLVQHEALARPSQAGVRAFYAGTGSRMFDAACYTEPVRAYLALEAAALEACVEQRQIRHVIEIGAGSGSYRAWAAARGIAYDGIDLATRTDAARADSRLHRGDAERIGEILHEAGVAIEREMALVILPFNCIGSLADPERVLAALASVGAPLWISRFLSDAQTTAARATYYERCGFAPLHVVERGEGTLIASRVGLWSLAWRPLLLDRLLTGANLEAVERVPLTAIAEAITAVPRHPS